jgi:hypothetical protein
MTAENRDRFAAREAWPLRKAQIKERRAARSEAARAREVCFRVLRQRIW